MTIHFAPLQGYADQVYRRLHAEIFGGIDAYYTPFIRIEKGAPRHQDMTRLRTALADDVPTVAQIIFSGPDEFSTLAEAVAAEGCRRIDLNLGCPYPMQTRKGRGAALISRPDVMQQIASMMAARPDVEFSVKMRLGLTDPEEWRQIMPILNTLKLTHITMHPRTARQMYEGEIYPDMFDEAVKASANPVVWNGDILQPSDIDAVLEAHPGIDGVMIGRGMLGRPSLVAEWRSGSLLTDSELLAKVLEMHTLLLEEYKLTLCGPTQILQKIKPFWEYLEPLIGRKAAKAIRKAGSLPKYSDAVRSL